MTVTDRWRSLCSSLAAIFLVASVLATSFPAHVAEANNSGGPGGNNGNPPGQQQTYTITPSAGPNGSISPSDVQTVARGDSQEFTFSANACYAVDTVTIDNQRVTPTPATSYTIENIQKDYRIHVTFSETPVDINITTSIGTGGSIAFDKETGSLSCGDDLSFTITPDDHYTIESITVDNTDIAIADTASYTGTFSSLDQGHEITATFKKITYTISASAGEHGSISPSGETEISEDGGISYTITPETGYAVSDILIDGYSVIGTISDTSSYTFSNVAKDYTIAVEFTLGYTITVTANANGSIYPGGSGTSTFVVVPGDDIAFSIIPDSCSEITDVTVDGVSQGAISSYVFKSVQQDAKLTASFSSSGGPFTLVAVPGAHTTISPEGTTTNVTCGASQTFTITYDAGLEDLYIILNAQTVQVIKDGEQVASDSVTFSATSENTFTFTLSDITTDYLISINEVFDISDFPLDIQTRPAPPNVMFVLDDSGSMDWEFMTEESSGLFRGNYYIFSDPGDNQYSSGILGVSERNMWKSQWCEYNTLYYNPNTDYDAWPELEEDDVSSSARSPKIRSHPTNDDSVTLDISATFTTISNTNIPNAHYYVYDEDSNTIYLVALDYNNQARHYYKVTSTSGSGSDQAVSTISETTSPPDSVVTGRSYEEEIQNWANWYTFCRKRELAATMAISSVIDEVSNVRIGLRSINYSSASSSSGGGGPGGSTSSYGIIKKLTPIKVLYLDTDGEYVYEDGTSELLSELYSLEIQQKNTPLRSGLDEVGKYFDCTQKSSADCTDSSADELTDNPWFSRELGGECQQSFTIVMTDGFWNIDSDLNIGNIDETKGQPYADKWSNTLADVAMYYNDDHDLVQDSSTSSFYLDDLVPGDNTKQHLNTYGVAFGVNGSLGSAAAYTLTPGCDESTESCNYPTWPNPASDNSYKIDDLFHAAVNGLGLFLSASNPEELVDSLVEAVSDIVETSGTAASLTVNADELYVSDDTGDILLFQTEYTSPDWYGSVYAYTVDIAATGDVTTTKQWEAGELLDKALDGGNDVSARLIATLKDDPNGASGIAFRDVSDLTATQQAWFEDELDDTTPQNMLDYIRGSNAMESSTLYRQRARRLGDIVHSGATFIDNYLYVGANDGMLHAFDINGTEKFCYLPSLVMPNLVDLTSQDYGDEHRYFVDGTPYGLEMTSSEDPNLSITYLIGGLGKGGKGYYMLDITDPDTITTDSELASRVLWEYPNAATPESDDTDDLGYSFSMAYIVDSNDQTITSGVTERDYLQGHMVVFGNGYGSANGNAVLYFLNAYTGELITKIDVGGSPGNGLSTPLLIDIDNDNRVDYIYAGDLHGNMWKFDVTSDDADEWQVAFCDDGNDKDSCQDAEQPQPLFQAADNQAITVRPDITYMDGQDGYMLIFGTGRFLNQEDWEDVSTQAFYGIWDFGDDDDDTEYLGRIQSNGTLSNSPDDTTWSLVEQTVIYEGTISSTVDGQEVDEEIRVISNNSVDYATTTDSNSIPSGTDDDGNTIEALDDPTNNVGWYFNLPDSGERMTTDPMIRDGKAIMVSFILDDDRCSGGAESWVHELDVYTGGRLSDSSLDINGDGVVDANDFVNIGSDSSDSDTSYPVSAVRKSGRLEAPVIIQKDDDTEVKLFSSSDGTLQSVTETSESQGVYYWREN